MGYDPYGTFDFTGVFVGLAIVTSTIIIVAFLGTLTPVGALVATGAIATGLAVTYAAATDSAMVVDLSISGPTFGGTHVKGGVSFVIDFDADEANLYTHGGGGFGSGSGPTYSSGIIENYQGPESISGHSVSCSGGFNGISVDHSWDPTNDYNSTLKTTTFTIAPFAISPMSANLTYETYSYPFKFLEW